MSRPRCRTLLRVDTRVHAQKLVDDLTVQIAATTLFDQTALAVGQDESGPYVVGDWRFQQEADQQTIRDWVRGVFVHPVQRTWVRSGFVSTHDCTHDEPGVQNCQTSNYVEFVR